MTILRTDVDALIPEEVTKEIIQGVPQNSVVMQLARKLPPMSRNQLRMPVLSALARAYFVSGDIGLKGISRQAWSNVYVNAEELAVIIPIPDSVLSDTSYDIWGECKPRIQEAFGIAFDASVFYATDGFGGPSPANWPGGIVAGATAAGHTVALGTGADIYDDIMSETGTLALVETDGFGVTGHVGALTMKSRLRGLRDANGQPIFMRSMQEKTRYELDGAETHFPENGSIDPAESLLISGDWKQIVYSIRQDMSYKILDQAVIQDSAGNIIFNLAQQDMVALRCVMRLGWQLPNPINRVNIDPATRYPFAVLTP
jgi:HK97 family phage major capsid protein